MTGPTVRLTEGSFSVPTSEGALLIGTFADGVRLRLGPTDLPEYPILVGDVPERAAISDEGEAGIAFTWSGFRLMLGREPLSFVLEETASSYSAVHPTVTSFANIDCRRSPARRRRLVRRHWTSHRPSRSMVSVRSGVRLE